MSELRPPDIAHLGPIELLTPKPQESLDFFIEMMGMEVQHREGQSVFLRGWDDYQIWSLKLTESPQSGMGYCGFRSWSPEALERRVALIEAAGLGHGWEEQRRLRHRAFVQLPGPRRPPLQDLRRGASGI